MLIDEALDILKARLETIDGLTVTTDTNVTVVVPMAEVTVASVNYNESFTRGACEIDFTVRVYVATSDNAEGLYEQRRYLSGHGGLSIRAAIESQITGGDLLLSKVVADTGTPLTSDNFIVAEFACRAHVPGAVAT